MKRILVVEDDEHIAQLLERELQRLGYEVGVRNSAKEGAESAAEFAPDMAILDVMLGDGLGYSVARRIRRDTKLYSIPIMFASVIGEEQDVKHAIEDGGDDYLVKPFTLDVLKTKLEQMEHLDTLFREPCAYTGMPGIQAMRRELEHRLCSDKEFALTYVFPNGLDHYRKAHGAPTVQKISFIVAKALRAMLKQNGIYETCCSHIGGGHFMIISELEDRRRIRHGIQEYFEVHSKLFSESGVPELPSSFGKETIFASSVNTGHQKFQHAAEMFDALRKLNQFAEKRERTVEHSERKRGGHERWVG